MKKIMYALTVALASFGLLLVVGCREQSKSIPSAERLDKRAAEPNQVVEPTAAPPTPDTAVAQGLAEISFDRTVCDAGEVGPGTINKCEFKFKNTGDGILKIGQIKTMCRCTVFELPKKEYEPGEAGVITVSYTASNYVGGTEEQPVHVPSNAKSNPEVKLTVKAKIVELVEATPQRLQLLLNEENAGVRSVHLRSRDGKAFSVKDFKSTSGNFISAEFDPKVTAAELELQPKVNIDELGAVTGGLSGYVEIELTHPGCRSVRIPFDVQPEFTVTPRVIYLSDVKAGQAITKELTVVRNYGEGFEVESTSSKNGFIKAVSQEAIAGGYRFKLQITPPPGSGRGPFNDIFYVQIKGRAKLAIACYGAYAR